MKLFLLAGREYKYREIKKDGIFYAKWHKVPVRSSQ
jgi:hypothetical protein